MAFGMVNIAHYIKASRGQKNFGPCVCKMDSPDQFGEEDNWALATLFDKSRKQTPAFMDRFILSSMYIQELEHNL